MVKFECVNDQLAELSIVDYQYKSEIASDKYDLNWLYIKLKVYLKEKAWEVTDPALLTWEVEELADWLMNLSENKVKYDGALGFIEPCLRFRLLSAENSEVKKIKMKFGLEFNPFSFNEDDIEVVFEADNQKLKLYANQLREELEQFPER